MQKNKQIFIFFNVLPIKKVNSSFGCPLLAFSYLDLYFSLHFEEAKPWDVPQRVRLLMSCSAHFFQCLCSMPSLMFGRPHLCIDHMFWPHAVVLFLLSAGPIWIPVGRTHRWTQWGSTRRLADTPASLLIKTLAEWQHITRSHQEDFSFIH